MKKTSALLLLIFALLLAGCAEAAAEPPADDTSAITDTAASGPIDRKRAVELASEFWGVKGGEIDEQTGFKMNVFVDESPTPEYNRYRICLRWLVEGHYSMVDEVYVDADSGEVYYLYDEEETEF
ncbi:MAG: hypothetical protein IJC50_05640 [Clostridia bacterium]|nr:hypothetical protein [Clostridia bacterium]